MEIFKSTNEALSSRFIRYARVDTQSDPNSVTTPSTEKQRDLSTLLVSELLQMGIADAHLDTYGYVYATIPSNVKAKVPVICFCAHVDTSSDCSGTDVKPIIHKNYYGEPLALPDDEALFIRLEDHPDLNEQFGNEIITASGTTLLGADNKAGVTAIMEAAQFLMQNRDMPHGEIKILFTPDEEIGRGVDNLDMVKLGSDFGYTIDGETLGSIEDETFSANGATLTIRGKSAHPGFAKGQMESSIKILSEIIASIPDALSPEHTADKEGFIHPVEFSGSVELAEAKFILRDFNNERLKGHGLTLERLAENACQNYPASTYVLEIHEQYRNMKEVLDNYPLVTEIATEAIARAGLTPIKRSIRGGTDGTRLSFMGLPCPNIFAGEHAFHGKEEWVSVQDMEKATEVVIHTAMIWSERYA